MFQNYYSTETMEDLGYTAAASMRLPVEVIKTRVAVWEEHCLECSAPQCYGTCPNFLLRQDGRCRLFHNSILQFDAPNVHLGIAANVKFRKWSNLLTVIYPAALTKEDYKKKLRKSRRFDRAMAKIVGSKLPPGLKFFLIRPAEYFRRRKNRNYRKTCVDTVNTFILHAFNHENTAVNMIVEIYRDHTPVYKMAFELLPGENMKVKRAGSEPEWNHAGNLVKVYPENNIEASVTFFSLDFAECEPVRKAIAEPSKTVKCVAWDLDNTLWDGILIETDDPAQLKLRDGVKNIIKELDRRGILQTIVSKNDFKPAFSQLKRLEIGTYFLYPMISWGPKSAALEDIAQKLNIGIDTFALFDDSVFERQEVVSRLPMVRTYDEKQMLDVLDTPPFQTVITEESASRRLMYQAEEKRNTVKLNDSMSIVDFIRDCNMTIKLFTPSTEAEITRCYELLQRTNQLNLSGKKYSTEEFDSLLQDPSVKKIAFSCEDRFGSYGIVCFCAYSDDGDTLTFREFVMSCRVAGKFVESAFFGYIKTNSNASSFYFPVRITAKNSLLRRTLEEAGFQVIEEESDASRILYTFEAPLKNSEVVTVEIRNAAE